MSRTFLVIRLEADGLAVQDAVGNRQRFEVKCIWAARACGPQSIVDAKYEAREVTLG